jgi:hypothetical protein
MPLTELSTLFRHVNEPVAVLALHDPTLLHQLRAEFPNHAELLSASGPALGDGELSEDDAAMTARTWSGALKSGARAVDALVPQLRAKLEQAETIELVVEVVGAISGSSLFVLVLSTNDSQAGKVIASAVTLMCSILTLVVRHYRKNLDGTSRLERMQKLIETAAEAESLAFQLDLWLATKPPRTALDPAKLEAALKLIKDIRVLTA